MAGRKRLSAGVDDHAQRCILLLLDDAAGIPPFENLTRYAKMGVDLCIVSAEEKVCVVLQCSGILLGLGSIPIHAALANNNPWEAPPRAMKVGKEVLLASLAGS